MSKISELSDGGALQSTDYLIAVRSGGNVKVQANGAASFTTLTASGDVNFDSGTFFVDASADAVGIGTSSPSAPLDIVSSATGGTTIELDNTSTGGRNFTLYSSGSGNSFGAGNFAIYDADAAAVRLLVDSSGNVGIGTSGPSQKIEVAGNAKINGNIGTDLQTLSAWTANTRALQLTTYGSVSSNDGVGFVALSCNAYESSDSSWKRVAGTSAGQYQVDFTGLHTWRRAGGATADSAITWTEQMRLDASGNLLVGKTTTDFGTQGIRLEGSNGKIEITRNGNLPFAINRLTSDGDLAQFYKDGTTVGSIGTAGGDFVINGTTLGLLATAGSGNFGWNSSIFYPTADNARDLGTASFRFDDIFATNGTIQTSDRNEKENIRELLEAEARVAQAAKGLLRAFQWKDSVAEKGDEARIHFGIIAQDLQAAFEAEGLDAGRYAMFIHSTWTDEETGEERSRMGVRYSELLAFIIAAFIIAAL